MSAVALKVRVAIGKWGAALPYGRDTDAEGGTYLAGSPGGELLGPRARLPLLLNTSLLECLLDGSGSGASGQRGDGVRGEDEVSVGDLLTGDRGGRAVDQCLGIVSADVSRGYVEPARAEPGTRYTETVPGSLELDLRSRSRGLTRLWSMISAITAILPADGPSLTRTTRPTSTNRLKVDGC